VANLTMLFVERAQIDGFPCRRDKCQVRLEQDRDVEGVRRNQEFVGLGEACTVLIQLGDGKTRLNAAIRQSYQTRYVYLHGLSQALLELVQITVDRFGVSVAKPKDSLGISWFNH